MEPTFGRGSRASIGSNGQGGVAMNAVLRRRFLTGLLAAIGAWFKVDYVIYVEINELSLYEPGNAQTIYRGKADLSVKLIDVKHPEESAPRKDFTCTYPSEANFIPVDEETPPQAFREKF